MSGLFDNLFRKEADTATIEPTKLLIQTRLDSVKKEFNHAKAMKESKRFKQKIYQRAERSLISVINLADLEFKKTHENEWLNISIHAKHITDEIDLYLNGGISETDLHQQAQSLFEAINKKLKKL